MSKCKVLEEKSTKLHPLLISTVRSAYHPKITFQYHPTLVTDGAFSLRSELRQKVQYFREVWSLKCLKVL